MPPPSSTQQKVLITQFVSLTGASERQATRFLKSAGFRLNEAVDGYYSASGEARGPSPLETKLDSLFESLRDDETDEKNKLELETTMGYFSNELNISLENAELFLVLDLIQAPSVGEITRSGYVDGWKTTGVGASHREHAAHIRKTVPHLSSDMALFKKVYKYAFVAGRDRDQKALALDNAMVYWGMLFTAPGLAWKSKNHDWLELWKSFLVEKWTRSVNRDMWNMTLEFALRTLSDDGLAFWSEDGAWPSVIDDFVDWCRAKGIGKSETMDIDDGQ